MKHYTLGFLFNTDGTHVVLIKKDRPANQAGKLNGCGGKLKQNELYFKCMNREGLEELGVEDFWHNFATFEGNDYKVRCYRSFNDEAYSKASMQKNETEEVCKIPVETLKKEQLVDNVFYLIHLALDRNVNEANISYHQF